jgi:hypothetical protein
VRFIALGFRGAAEYYHGLSSNGKSSSNFIFFASRRLQFCSMSSFVTHRVAVLLVVDATL